MHPHAAPTAPPHAVAAPAPVELTALRKASLTTRILLGAFVAFLVTGNLGIVAVHQLLRVTRHHPGTVQVEGVPNFHVVDERVWRGAAPSPGGYAELAHLGVGTVVDLRAERGLDVPEAELAEQGVDVVRLPIRDGQIPSEAQIATFAATVAAADAPVFVHCGAGVGRTGVMVAAYRVRTGRTDGLTALREALAVGPPSVEQLAFIAALADDGGLRPGPLVVTASRVLDAPRRLLARLD